MADAQSANQDGAEGPRGTRAASGSPAAVRRGRPAWAVKAERLDQERMLQGVSQERLARVAHLDRGTLSDTLCKKRRPTLGTLSALCRALALHLGDVIVFDPSPAMTDRSRILTASGQETLTPSGPGA